MYLNCVCTAYIAIGARNISAIIGPYVQSLLIATQKLGIPYFELRSDDDDVTGEELRHFRPYNLLSVAPPDGDVCQMTVALVQHLSLQSVAVIYDNDRYGTLSSFNARVNQMSWLDVHGIRRLKYVDCRRRHEMFDLNYAKAV